MKYITGKYALNLSCKLNTPGDWHTSALNWEKISFSESNSSIFGDYGIEKRRTIPDNKGIYCVANHIRAVLDLIESKKFSDIQNFNKEYICDDAYDEEIFEKVKLLLPDKKISDFMHKTYGRKWRIWIEKNMDK